MKDIRPGSKVKITVARTLRSERAKKTLARLFLKDPRIARTRRQKPKEFRGRRRAGRIWYGTDSGSAAVTPKVGDSASLTVTLDVLRDLTSVLKYLEVK